MRKFVADQISPLAWTWLLEVSDGPVTSKPMSLKFSGLTITYLPTVGNAPVCGKFIP